MNHSDAQTRGTRFRELHERRDLLLLANPWDAGSARLFENMGFEALATTSAGLAFALGRRDGDGVVSADETLRNAETIAAATSLPVSADLENGFGESPEIVAETIRRAGSAGLAGASIEDATYRASDPILDHSLAVERIHAAVEAARAISHPFTLTARAENFIRGNPDLDDTLARLQAFEAAGADVLFAPGLPDENALRRVCSSLERPVNYVGGVGDTRFTLEQLAAFGVRRVSVGASFARAGLSAVMAAAREVRESGTFDYLDGVPTVSAFSQLIDPRND